MDALQKKIYDYFERDPMLKVLFIFDNGFMSIELENVDWLSGFKYIEFKGDWFTIKYNLDNLWQNEKVILLFHQPSPLKVKSLQASFPLMDILAANMEYHSQDYAAYIQQYGLPESDKKLCRFVEKNINQLQSDKILKLMMPYYKDGSISYDMMVRGFICSYLGLQRILDWDNIIVRILLLGRQSEHQRDLIFM